MVIREVKTVSDLKNVCVCSGNYQSYAKVNDTEINGYINSIGKSRVNKELRKLRKKI